MLEWAKLSEDLAYHQIAFTGIGPYLVSTIWLGLNHNWLPGGRPVIFETMTFSKAWDVQVWNGTPFLFHPSHSQERYSTEAEALRGHYQTVNAIMATLPLGAVPALIQGPARKAITRGEPSCSCGARM
jgi:hypothetical protein